MQAARLMAALVAYRQVAFFAPVHGGKFHAAWLISGVPVCGATSELDQSIAIRTSVGGSVHPMVCKRCQAKTTSEAGSAHGVQR